MIYIVSLFMGTFLYIVSTFSTLPFLNDFYSYYIGGKLILHSLPLYGVTDAFLAYVEKYNFQFLQGTGYSYPPLLAEAMIPISSLPFAVAGIIWTSMQILLYGLFIRQVVKTIYLQDGKYLLPILLFFGPACGSILNGQINIVVLWCLYFYFYSKNELLRAVGLCVAGWIKVFPFVLLAKDVLFRRKKFILIFIPVFIILLVLQIIPRSGQYIIEYFLQMLPRLQTGFDPYITNQSLVGVVSRFQGATYNHTLVTIVECLLFSLLLGITVVKGKTHKQEIDLLWLITILLVAGKNSYWNMTPSIFVYMYLFRLRAHIDVRSKIILLISSVLSLVFPYILFTFIKYPLLLTTIEGKIFSSLGFFSVFMLYYPLIRMTFGKNITK